MNDDKKEEVNSYQELYDLILNKEEFLDKILDIKNDFEILVMSALNHEEATLRRMLNKVFEPLEDLASFVEESIEADNHICEECAAEEAEKLTDKNKEFKVN